MSQGLVRHSLSFMSSIELPVLEMCYNDMQLIKERESLNVAYRLSTHGLTIINI